MSSTLPTFELTPAKESPVHETSEKPSCSTQSPRKNAAIVASAEMISVPSTESLIPSDKPAVPSRGGRKIEDIKPVKRQPKTGWL